MPSNEVKVPHQNTAAGKHFGINEKLDQGVAVVTITEDKLRERAHRIWIEEGQPHGREREHWERAQWELEIEQAAGDPAEDADQA